MPTYEYKCTACGHQFEQFQSITAAPIKRCPQCGKAKVKRLLGTGAGVIFKGSGFYITDYRDSSYKEKAKAESGSGTSGSSEGSSESKPTGGETKAADAKPAESKPAASSDKSDAAPKSPGKSDKKSKK
jgi:putative FmdB family regulatory protein